MSSIHPSAALVKQKYALISALRAQGLAIAEPGAAFLPGDTALVTEGDAIAHPARTVIVNDGPVPSLTPAQGGRPATVTYPASEAGVGNSFVRALVAGPEMPTAADPESLALFTLAERVAQADITVLINGPTGTGKDVVARAIHAQSPRAGKPFVAINCAALPESMLEALLFGHQKGAFTGAAQAGEGFFRAADGGTLPEKIDVRVIACANRDLQSEVAEGRFRADLYYRLSVFPLSTLALNERAGDIAALAAAMIVRHGADRRVLPWIDAQALSLLQRHDWPGTVRELENVIQRAMLLARGDCITPADIIFDRPTQHRRPELVAVADTGDKLSNIVQMSEFQAIRETLAACGGSRIETAKRLGISERTLRYRLAKAREQGEDIVQTHSQAVNA